MYADLNDCTFFGMAGVGAESISAVVFWADMESAPTVVISMIP